jgi:4-amino-4-deoxy-L-arabinose transferase-like glycosyltransferase
LTGFRITDTRPPGFFVFYRSQGVELSLQPSLKIPTVSLTVRRSEWLWRFGAAVIILGSAAAHIAYLAHNCPLDLAPDEAHYWDWSRHLDWSYYSKGPLVAYLIRLGCATCGDWSRELMGNEMLAVRVPAVVCGSLLLVSLYVLTRLVFRREALAFAVVAIALTLPIVATGSTLMTIDAPYTCCWGWALVIGHRAIFGRSAWAWPLLGLIIGLGILAKYTMVLWIPSVGFFLLFSTAHRPLLWSRGFWTMLGIVAFCCLPILIWNWQHHWVTLRHVFGQAGLQDTEGFRWLGPLTFIGTQFALFLGYWFVAWAAAVIRYRPWRQTDPGITYLWWMSLTTIAFFLAFSVRSDEEPNWPVAGYLSGLVLAAAWIAEQLQTPHGWYRRQGIGFLAVISLIGIGLTIAMHDAESIQPLLLSFSGPVTPLQPTPLRRFDPSCRLRGWRTGLAAAVDDLRRQLGNGSIVAATSWTIPGELGFYCAGNPTVYSLGLVAGDRHSQYDLWRPNPIADPEEFLGRTMIVVGDLNEKMLMAFERIDPTQIFVYRERGQPIAEWRVTVCRGFRGFPPVEELGHF